MPTHAHGTLRHTEHFIVFGEKPAEKPTAKCAVSESVSFGSTPAEPDVLFGDKSKNRPCHFSLSVLKKTGHG